MPTPKPIAGSFLPTMKFQTVSGDTITVGAQRNTWTLLVVYRGRHCPRCKRYLNTLNEMRAQWLEAGFDIVVVSADTKQKARADMDEFGWQFDLAYGLSEAQMHDLGLYITEPLSDAETTQRFAEPGTYVIRPDGSILLIAISNGPSARPDLSELLDGMIFTKQNDRPPRGTV